VNEHAGVYTVSPNYLSARETREIRNTVFAFGNRRTRKFNAEFARSEFASAVVDGKTNVENGRRPRSQAVWLYVSFGRDTVGRRKRGWFFSPKGGL